MYDVSTISIDTVPELHDYIVQHIIVYEELVDSDKNLCATSRTVVGSLTYDPHEDTHHVQYTSPSGVRYAKTWSYMHTALAYVKACHTFERTLQNLENGDYA